MLVSWYYTVYVSGTRKKEEVIVGHTKFSREHGSLNMGMGLVTLQMIKLAQYRKGGKKI